ncbi:hypothetical protein ACX27_01050 [Nostoc piscinale CENA21]|uniref:Uncharacterized protein n=1 Tax=Nostoc piscinale CENA21 TaxID=224013 RepID=A0A0M5MLU7_9NOSO|nr:hypothetical protein ACX27_01050 [Nostoc piscinale CENA21]
MVPDTAYYFRPLSVEGRKLAIAKIYQFMICLLLWVLSAKTPPYLPTPLPPITFNQKQCQSQKAQIQSKSRFDSDF